MDNRIWMIEDGEQKMYNNIIMIEIFDNQSIINMDNKKLFFEWAHPVNG